MSNAPKIRFIVETYTSERDSNGNCYHFAAITSTMTGARMRVDVGGANNAPFLVKKALGEWDAVHSIAICLPKREWRRAYNGVAIYEHNVTSAQILSLEVATP